ncbi:TolB family protein [Kitasatospora aburaviensis]
MTGTRQLPPTTTARTRTRAGAGLLLAGALLTGCGAEPGEIPLSEIRAETPPAAPTPTPAPEPAVAVSAAPDPALAAAASARHNGLIVGRIFLTADRTNSAVFTIAPDGSGAQQLTRPPAQTRDDHPDWSPDGTTVAFDRTGPESAGRIWTIGADGENPHQVGQLCETGAPDCTNEEEVTPAFSPTASRSPSAAPGAAPTRRPIRPSTATST